MRRTIVGVFARTRLVQALLGVALAVAFVSWVRRTGDFEGYVLVGRVLLKGGHIYADLPPTMNTWPPFFSLFCVPLALLARIGPTFARSVWLALNLVVLVAVVRLLVRLVHGRTLALQPGAATLTPGDPAIVVPLLLGAPYLASNFSHLQVNLLIFGLALWGLVLQARSRALGGGIALGLAAALKVMPVLFLPYLAYRGRWRAAATMCAATLAFSLSPVLVFGPARFADYVVSWRAALARGWSVGKMNQSVFAMFDRLIGHGMAPFSTPGVDGVLRSGDPGVLLAVLVLAAAVAAVALVTFRGEATSERWAAPAEWSVVFICSAIFGPVTWKAYLLVLLLPYMLLAAVWQAPDVGRGTRRTAGALLGASFALGVLSIPEVTGDAFAQRLGMSSGATVAALVACGGMLWLRGRLRADALSGRTPTRWPRSGAAAGGSLS